MKTYIATWHEVIRKNDGFKTYGSEKIGSYPHKFDCLQEGLLYARGMVDFHYPNLPNLYDYVGRFEKVNYEDNVAQVWFECQSHDSRKEFHITVCEED